MCCQVHWQAAPPRIDFKLMGIIAMDGDGDCLFHALGYFDNFDGKELQMNIANFMDGQVWRQAGFFEEGWHQDVERLRANQPANHVAIAAYSLMMETRVMVHTTGGPMAGFVPIQEMSHASIYGSETARTVHILHNDMGRFDALVELAPVQKAALPCPGPCLQTLAPSSLHAPVAAYSRAYVAEWTTKTGDDENAVSQAEREEMLRVAGWLMQLLCTPQHATGQLRAALRSRQAMLRQHFGRRLLPWPWSFMVHGMIL